MREHQGIPCPKCGKKGLHVPNHPHAFGRKDHGKVACRYCHARFVRKPRLKDPENDAPHTPKENPVQTHGGE